jgi:PAS domain S-box-containing protein
VAATAVQVAIMILLGVAVWLLARRRPRAPEPATGERLRQSEARLNNAQRIAEFGSWDMWLGSGRLEVSDEGLRLLGLPRNNPSPKVEEVLARFHPEDMPAVKKARGRSIRDGEPYTVEYRLTLPRGQVTHICERGEASRDPETGGLRLSGVVQDISELRRAESALREQETFYRELIEILPDTVYIHVDNRIVMANSATVEMFGADSLDDIIGRDPDTLVHPDELEAVRNRRTAYWHAGYASPYHRYWYRRLDGSRFLAESCAVTIQWDGTPARLIVNRNIATALRAETALRESAERLKEAQRIARVGDWEHDLDTGRSYWSEEMFRIFGVPQTEGARSRRQFLDMVHPDDLDIMLNSARDAEKSPTGSTSEYRIIRRDGEIRHVHTSREFLHGEAGSKGSVRGITQDITQLKHGEEELRANEERFRDLVEGTPHAVVIRASDGTRHYVNQAFLEMFGYESPEAARELPPGSLTALWHRDRVLGYFEARKRGEPAPDTYQIDCQRSDGSTFPGQFHVREIT